MWLRALVVFLVLAFGAYTAVWFRHADQTKTEVEKFFSELEKKDAGVTVAYDSLNVGGFPFQFVTRIKDPVFTLDYAKFVKTVFSKIDDEYAPKPELGAKETASIKGEATLTTNYFTRSISLKFSGMSEGESRFGEKTLHWATSGEADGGCTVFVSKGADLSMLSPNVFSNFENPEKLLKNFESIDCLGEPVEIVTKENGNMLFRTGEQVFSISNKSAGENKAVVNATLNSSDMEMSDEWRDWQKELMQSINPRQMHSRVLPISSHEAVGKQNVEIKLSYEGPVAFNDLEHLDIKLNVPTFSISNNLYHFSTPFALNILRNGAQVTGDASFEGAGKYEAAMDGLLSQSVNLVVDDLYAGNIPELTETFAPVTARVDADTLKESVGKAVPAFGMFGTLTTNLKASFKGSEDEKFHQRTGEATIDQFKLLMGAHGFSASGSMVMVPPRGELSLRCHQCRETVEKLLDYAVNLQNIMSYFDASVTPITVDDAFRKAAVGFVDSFSQPIEDEEADRLIQISDSGNGQVVISGHPIQEVMMLGMQTFLPRMAPPPPPEPQ